MVKKKVLILFLLFFNAFLFSYSEKHVCEVCGGSGILKCGYCSGRGKVMTQRGTNKTTREMKRCSHCNGSGNQRCKACDGNGWYMIEYNLPPEQMHENKHEHERYACATCNGRGNVVCPSCRDSHYGAGRQICYKCLGQGYKVVNLMTGDKEICVACQGEGSLPCSKCGGDGRVDCASCNGMGYFEER